MGHLVRDLNLLQGTAALERLVANPGQFLLDKAHRLQGFAKGEGAVLDVVNLPWDAHPLEMLTVRKGFAIDRLYRPWHYGGICKRTLSL